MCTSIFSFDAFRLVGTLSKAEEEGRDGCAFFNLLSGHLDTILLDLPLPSGFDSISSKKFSFFRAGKRNELVERGRGEGGGGGDVAERRISKLFFKDSKMKKPTFNRPR